MKVGDRVKVALTKKINGKPSNEKKFFWGAICKINPKRVHVTLEKNGDIIERRRRDIVKVMKKVEEE